MRKIIQVTEHLALCNDGTLWRWSGDGCGWERVPDVPQPKDPHVRRKQPPDQELGK